MDDFYALEVTGKKTRHRPTLGSAFEATLREECLRSWKHFPQALALFISGLQS